MRKIPKGFIKKAKDIFSWGRTCIVFHEMKWIVNSELIHNYDRINDISFQHKSADYMASDTIGESTRAVQSNH